MRFHLSSDGEPRPCRAEPGRCPLGAGRPHFSTKEEARSHYESAHDPVAQNPPVRLLKHRSYAGIHVPENSIQEFLERWRNRLGERAHGMEAQKDERDGGRSYHMTVLDPRETRALKKSGKIDEFLERSESVSRSIHPVGVGTASTGEKEAWFVVVESEELNRLREELDLPRKDFHITIGFDGGDVHGVPKDSSSLADI